MSTWQEAAYPAAAQRTEEAAKAAGFFRTGRAAYPEPNRADFPNDALTWHRNLAPNLEAHSRAISKAAAHQAEANAVADEDTKAAALAALAEVQAEVAHLEEVIGRHGYSRTKIEEATAHNGFSRSKK